VDHGHRPASCDSSLVVSGGVYCGRRRRNVYDKKPQSYAKGNRTASTHRSCPSSGLCSGDVPTIAELVDHADDELFEKVLCNPQHVLYNSLPNETVSFYELRHRPHNRELIYKTSRLAEASFIVRMLYKDIY